MERGCLTAIGLGVALLSLFFVAAATVEVASGSDGKTSPGVYAGLIVFFSGSLLASLYLIYRMVRPRPAPAGGTATGFGAGAAGAAPPPPSTADRERLILRLVAEEHGRVTVPEVAVRCDLTVAEAKVALDGLVAQGVATINVTDGGVLVYVFPGFLSDEDKAQAQDF